MAPEIREAPRAIPTSDIYTAGAILYFAVTGHEPPLDPPSIKPPSELRPNCPRAIERILLRALRPAPDDRYLTAAEMLEDFASDAGTFDNPAAAAGASPRQLPKATMAGTGRSGSAGRWATTTSCSSSLGTGGYGRVYRVRDLHLEREVALKVLHPHLTRGAGGGRAVPPRGPARGPAQPPQHRQHLRHRRTGRLDLVHHGAGARARTSPRWWSATARCRWIGSYGCSRRRSPPWPRPMAPGWCTATSSRRTCSPSRTERLRITDFGLALALRGQGKFGGATSQSGTPMFASPEQLLGERVDQRSDLYSLAAVAYFALLGRPPFSGSTVEQVLGRQTTNQLPPLREERPDVSEDLERVLARALQCRGRTAVSLRGRVPPGGQPGDRTRAPAPQR